MKIELSQEGSPKIGDTIVYCGENTWCWEKQVKSVVKKETIVKTEKQTIPKPDNKPMQFAMVGVCLALLALIVAISATLKKHR